MWLPAPRSFRGELFYHNFSRMDSPEIKSVSWTASGGANIPVHFFIDLHSTHPPPHSPLRLKPTPTRRCLLLFPSCLRCPDLQWSPGLRLMMSCAIFIISAFEISGEEERGRKGRGRGRRTWTRPEMAGGGRKNTSTLRSPKLEFARQFALRCSRESHQASERISNVWIVRRGKNQKEMLTWFGTNDEIISIGDYVKIKAPVS